ncbi:MAG TPA: DNA polymerase domain-containing protein [Blastocatellia bacterium]|nr:DNA polymerase domain-containing protein [Blastocatellia bacterium]
MADRRLEGWLFDVDDLGPEVALWVYANDRRLVRLTHAFRQPVYVQGQSDLLKLLAWDLHRRGIVSSVRWTERREFWSGATVSVLELLVTDSSMMPRLRRIAAARDRELIFYNCDIPAAQYYLYLNRLFPLCKLACRVDPSGRVLEIAATDSPFEALYALPDLSILDMRGERLRPVGAESRVTLACRGERVSFTIGDGARAVGKFNAFLDRHDPDVILSRRGDTIIMPALLRLAAKEKARLRLDRDRVVTKRRIETGGRTFFSYGRIIYKGPSYPLFGRWHIDRENSFIHRETELDGLVELARLAKVPVQRMARTSPGSAMSSMQMDRAIADRILVPWRKSEPESYKTALDLLTVDKGGLVFYPPTGAFSDVAEIDFTSMYPSIMVRHNISPETVLCSCCDNRAVPEAGYNICEKRPGLIPAALAPLLERRRLYKRLIEESRTSEEREIYDSRQTAIKWMLVSCFGYLGYKNARFGRIEAHEAVTAFGRDKLLRAKEMAEGAGFRMLHALTDNLWIKKEGATESDLLALCRAITRETGIEMGLEGIYKWLVFLPSKVKSSRAVPARYYGVFAGGRLKVRGLACRRSDTPRFIKDVQSEMLAIVARAGTLEERAELIAEAEAVLRERIGELERGEVDPKKLLVKRTLSKEMDGYAADTKTAVAARQLRKAGIEVRPGEPVQYLLINTGSKNREERVQAHPVGSKAGYDAGEYIRLLKAAAAEVTYPGPTLYLTPPERERN